MQLLLRETKTDFKTQDVMRCLPAYGYCAYCIFVLELTVTGSMWLVTPNHEPNVFHYLECYE